MTLAIVFIVIGLLTVAGFAFLFGKYVHSFIHNLGLKEFSKDDRLRYYGYSALMGVGASLFGLGVFLLHEEWVNERALRMALFLIGLFFFVSSAALLISSAVLRTKKTKKTDSYRKENTWTFALSIVFVIASFLVFMEGLSPYLDYPLISGFAIGSDGFYWVSAAHRAKSGDFHLAWYGVIIVSGALVSYFVSDAHMFKEYGRHGLLDLIILVAFPAGIIGARIWYVVGNFEREFANGKSNPIAIWDGGLTILGGAVAGVLAGYLIVKFCRKYCDPRFTCDACVPSILLAQAIGRWGNFFNNEVYGQTVSMDGWMWLPSWIRNQMHFNGYTGTFLATNMMNVPLFLIEGMFNVAGYFVIVYVFGKLLKKYAVRGDLTGLYFIWYGITRVIMEPMRNSSFNMGSDNAWSICNSLIYIVLGLALCSYFHLYDYYKKNENHKGYVLPFASAFIAMVGALFIFLPSLSGGYTDGSNHAKLLFTHTGAEVLFNAEMPLLLAGFILLLIGIVLMIGSGVLIIKNNEKYSKILAFSASCLFLITIVFFLFGQGVRNGLPSTSEGMEVTYSLSYGFFLLLGFSAWSLFLSIDYLMTYRPIRPLAPFPAKKED